MSLLSGLIIDTPYIDNILGGGKTWELRTTHTQKRGLIALIRKGSGLIVGVAELTGSSGPLSSDELRANSSRHMLSPAQLADPAIGKWNHAWILQAARSLLNPVPYVHPPGAVIWVKSRRADVCGGAWCGPVGNPTTTSDLACVGAPRILCSTHEGRPCGNTCSHSNRTKH